MNTEIRVYFAMMIVAAATIAMLVVLIGMLMLNPAIGAERVVVASTYGDARDIRRTGETRTATGARIRPDRMWVAHRTLPFGTWLTLRRGRHMAVVVVNDRGPFIRGRDLDLTYAVNRALMCGGLCRVRVEPWRAPLPRPRPQTAIAWGEEGGP